MPTTTIAAATQEQATVTIDPDDADGDLENRHQVNLETETALTIKFTSANGDRTRSYRVVVNMRPCLEGITNQRLNQVVFLGGSVGELDTFARSLDVDALFHLRNGAGTTLFVSQGLPRFLSQPFRPRFTERFLAGKMLIAARVNHEGRAVGTADPI